MLRVGKLSGDSDFRTLDCGFTGRMARWLERRFKALGTEEVALTATNSGTFTVLVSDGAYHNGDYANTGTYQLNYTKVPGQLRGFLGRRRRAIDQRHVELRDNQRWDIDAWSFTANTGDSVVCGWASCPASPISDPGCGFTGRMARWWERAVHRAQA